MQYWPKPQESHMLPGSPWSDIRFEMPVTDIMRDG